MLLPIVFLLLWSSGFSVARIGLDYVEPLTFLAMRYVCVVGLLLPVQLIFRLPWPDTVRDWGNLAIIGFLIQFVYFGFNYLSLTAGLSAGAFALIASMQPVLVAVIAPLAVGEQVTLRQWQGLLLGFAGAAVVIFAKSEVEATSLLSVGLALIALCGLTSGVVCEKRTKASVHPVMACLVQCMVGLLLSAPPAFFMESNQVDWSYPLIGSLAYLVICNTLISISILLALVRRHQLARVSSLFFMVPPLAVLMAAVLLEEVMPDLAWAGLALAAFGVWLANRPAG